MKYSIVITLLLSSASAIAYRPYVDGRTPWYKTMPREHAVEYPRDYYVPSYGVDREITASLANTHNSEIRHKHKMHLKKHKKHSDEEEDVPKDYKVPNFGMDHDIISTHKHMADAEKRIGHKWVV